MHKPNLKPITTFLSKAFRPEFIFTALMLSALTWLLLYGMNTTPAIAAPWLDGVDDNPCLVCTRYKWCNPAGDGNPDTSNHCCVAVKDICTLEISATLDCKGSNNWCVGDETLMITVTNPKN